jgi:hypothetical protein
MYSQCRGVAFIYRYRERERQRLAKPRTLYNNELQHQLQWKPKHLIHTYMHTYLCMYIHTDNKIRSMQRVIKLEISTKNWQMLIHIIEY